MKIIRKILSIFLTYKFLALIESIYYYIKDYNRISDIFYSDGLKKIIKKYLNCDLSKDWIGRLYGIINPAIDIDGNLNVSSMIIEIDDNNTNNNEYVKNWIYRQLNLVNNLFKIERLYEYIVMDVRHVGPATHDNYLVVFDLASRKYMARCLRHFLIQLFIYIIIAVIILFLI